MASIQLHQLTLSFGEKKVLDSITHTFHDGITVLHGNSGVGKTTLLHAIAGIYTDYTGEILLQPKDRLAYCLQEDLFFSNLTVQENMHLKYVACEKPEENETEEVLETLSLFGIEALLTCKAKTLSGGERQRLKMAMLALTKPDIVLLDEPTAKLDDDNIANTLAVIERVWQDKLLLIVSHDKLSFSKPITEICMQGGKLQ
ncbi:MAG: ATP-binding cassette domain-containing protein [Oscillospiraceae bacterium]|jgi:ABC-type multidrug transport system ATPase subunit|nr:ATP-binding cassette domain-containing protein [Oscillospiraceae bacterium]